MKKAKEKLINYYFTEIPGHKGFVICTTGRLYMVHKKISDNLYSPAIGMFRRHAALMEYIETLPE
jgi:hypothetical protein